MKTLILALAFLVSTTLAHAADYWVSATGGSTASVCGDADGSTDPGVYYRTITVLIAAGCINSGTNTVFVKPAGGSLVETVSNPPSNTTFKSSDPATKFVIAPSGNTAFNFTQARSNVIWENVHFRVLGSGADRCGLYQLNVSLPGMAVRDFECEGPATAVAANTSAGFKVFGGTVTFSRGLIRNWRSPDGNPGSHGFYWQASGGTVEQVTVENVNGYCLQWYNGGAFAIANNTWDRNLCRDTTVGSEGGNRLGLYATQGLSSGNRITRSIFDTAGRIAVGGTNTLFLNNSIYNSPTAIQVSCNSGCQILNTITWQAQGISGSTGATLTNNTTTDPSFVSQSTGNFNVPSAQASNGSDLTANGILHNTTAGRGALDPMQVAAGVTLSANTIRLTVSNSYGALRNVSATGFTCSVNATPVTVTAAVASGNTTIDLTVNATMDSDDTIICSYTNATGTILNSIGIGNRTDALGNAHLQSFTDQAITNTLEVGAGDDDPPATDEVGINTETADTTSHGATVPLNIVAGDLLIAHLSLNGVPTISDMTGWTQACRAANTNVVGEIWYKVAAGVEEDFTYTSSASERSTTYIFRIPVASWHGTTPPECATATGSSVTPDAPSLNPTGWATENSLWFAFFSRFRGDAVVTAYPVNYPDNQNNDDTGTTSADVQMGSASRTLNTESEDPPSFTVGGIQNWAAFTVAVRPVGEPPIEVPTVVWEQLSYCWKYWQDAETVACSSASGTRGKAHGFGRIIARIGLKVTGDDPEPSAMVGEYRITPIATGTPGQWIAISNSACASPCIEYATPRVRSNGQATTRLLALPADTTFAAGALQAQAGASAVFDFSQDAAVEFDQSLQLVGLSKDDIVEIRMRHEIGTLYDTYTVYATLVVVADSASGF